MSNPYVIRENLLHLACNILESQSRSKKNATAATVYPYGDDLITTEQIIAEATKLNEFVSGNKD